MFLGLLVPFTITCEKPSAAVESAVSATPVPESAVDTGPLGSESSTVTIPPAVAPRAVGTNATPMTQEDLAASTPLMVPPACGHVVGLVGLLSSANGPLKTAEVMLSGVF